jgi:outer membrane autotransporter protein
MKSKLIRTGLVALALTLASPAVPAPAQDMSALYIAPKVSYSFRTADISDGWNNNPVNWKDKDRDFGFGLAVGTDMGLFYDVPLRVELEYMYRLQSEFSDGGNTAKVAAHSLMANGYFDINTSTDFTPYIGAGLGMAYRDADYTSNTLHTESDQSWNLAWNLGAGVAYHVTDTMALDMGYRYVDLGGSNHLDYTAHELLLVLRFSGF